MRNNHRNQILISGTSEKEVTVMNPDMELVKKINGLAGKVRPFDLAMDLFTRYGHWAFVIYGLLLWFAPGSDREKRRRSCLIIFTEVIVASLISFIIGKVWFRKRPFTRDPAIWNFTGHKANASFPSNHTMHGSLIAMELLRYRFKGSWLMTLLAGILAFSRLFAGMHYPTDLLGGFTLAGMVHFLFHRPSVIHFFNPIALIASFISDVLVMKVRGR